MSRTFFVHEQTDGHCLDLLPQVIVVLSTHCQATMYPLLQGTVAFLCYWPFHVWEPSGLVIKESIAFKTLWSILTWGFCPFHIFFNTHGLVVLNSHPEELKRVTHYDLNFLSLMAVGDSACSGLPNYLSAWEKCLAKFLPFFVVLEIDSGASGMLSKCSPTYQ